MAILPFLGLFFLDYVWMGVPAYYAAANMENTKEGADLVLKVTSSQWKWQYEYPAQGIKFVSSLSTPKDQITGKAPKDENYLLEVDNPVVLPVNHKVRILLTSSDVMHAWGVPAFGVKRSTVPGFLRETWVKIEKEGTYRGQCAQICGKDHAFMPIVVEAVSDQKFAEWVAKKQAENVAMKASAVKVWTKEELMIHGQGIYEKICVACHQPGGKGLPGIFPALAGSKLINGPFLDAQGRMIKDGHLDRVMNGKTGTAMQAFKNTLSDVDIAAIVTYERNSFGNTMGDMVQPAQVQALR
ncbi:cytochrome c oxidase subunit II [Gammaproteobacteria bacterium]